MLIENTAEIRIELLATIARYRFEIDLLQTFDRSSPLCQDEYAKLQYLRGCLETSTRHYYQMNIEAHQALSNKQVATLAGQIKAYKTTQYEADVRHALNLELGIEEKVNLTLSNWIDVIVTESFAHKIDELQTQVMDFERKELRRKTKKTFMSLFRIVISFAPASVTVLEAGSAIADYFGTFFRGDTKAFVAKSVSDIQEALVKLGIPADCIPNHVIEDFTKSLNDITQVHHESLRVFVSDSIRMTNEQLRESLSYLESGLKTANHLYSKSQHAKQEALQRTSDKAGVKARTFAKELESITSKKAKSNYKLLDSNSENVSMPQTDNEDD